jgi:hypothetical protein
MGASVKSVLEEVTGVVNAPLIGSVSIKELFLVTGVVIVAVIAWIMILGYMRAAAETVADIV